MRPAFFYWTHLLSLTKALSHLYQSYHWQTRGAQFYGDHLLFERLYGTVSAEVDQVAERAIGVLNNHNVVDPVVISQNVAKIILSLTPMKEDGADPEEMSVILLTGERLYAKLIDEMLEALKEQDNLSNGVEDFLQGLASAHQTSIYLLQQRAHEQVSGETPVTASWNNEKWKTAGAQSSWSKVLKESGGNEAIGYSVYKTLQAIEDGGDPQESFSDALANENLHGKRPDIMKDRKKAEYVLKKHYKVNVKA